MGDRAKQLVASGAGRSTAEASYVSAGRATHLARRLVAILVVGGVGFLGLALAGCTASGPAPSPSSSPSATTTSAAPLVPSPQLVKAVFAKLPSAARSAPAFTWNSAGKVGQGTASDRDDAVLMLAAACDRGGELTITINDKSTVMHCSRFTVAGPINLTAAMGTDAPGGVDVDVRPTAGHPRYIAKAVSLAPDEVGQTASEGVPTAGQ